MVNWDSTGCSRTGSSEKRPEKKPGYIPQGRVKDLLPVMNLRDGDPFRGEVDTSETITLIVRVRLLIFRRDIWLIYR
jgi:hypothetical protein